MIAPFQGTGASSERRTSSRFRSGYPDEVTALVKEAVSTQKKQMVVVYQNVTYGPAMMQLIQDMSKKEGLNVVAYVKLDATAPDKLDAIVKDVVAEVLKAFPDSIILLGGGGTRSSSSRSSRNRPTRARSST